MGGTEVITWTTGGNVLEYAAAEAKPKPVPCNMVEI